MKNLEEIKSIVSGKTMEDENFPVSSFLISKKHRKHIYNLYYFARISDDIADNKNLSVKKKKLILNEFDIILKEKKKTHYNFINDLINSTKTTANNIKYPRQLLVAFIQDSEKNRYKNWGELINYCNYSASPIGRFVIDLHNLKKNNNNETIKKIYAGCDNLCNCLQILNHIQDCKDDFEEMNRVYIPENYFIQSKISVEKMLFPENRKKILMVLKKCLKKVEVLLDDSIENIKLINNYRLKRETYVIFNIAKKLTRLLAENDPIEKKIKLSRIDLIFCFFKGIIGRL